VRPIGLGPITPSLVGWCSGQLSYRRNHFYHVVFRVCKRASGIDAAGVRARADAVGSLTQAIKTVGFDDIRSEIQDYCGAMLDRPGDLRKALGSDHPAIMALADQELPAEFLERARDLLLAHLIAGE
jgi:hypothetical protein